MNDLLASSSDYTSQHRAQTTTDASGQSTTYTYNSVGQPLTVTNAKNVYGPQIADHAFAFLLALTRKLNVSIPKQHLEEWPPGG